MIIYSAEIYPVSPGFLEMDVKNLIALASEKQAVPMFATIILASENEEHFNDGVIVTEDKTKFMISAFDRINEEEFE